MTSYQYQGLVTETLTDSSGLSFTHINPQRLEQFKSYMEHHVAVLTTEVQVLKQHADWIEPRLNDYHKFMEWMQRVHPDVIEAYTQSTKVEKTLNNALEIHDEAYAQVMERSA